MKIDEHKKPKTGNADPTRDENEGMFRGGEGKTPVTTFCPESR